MRIRAVRSACLPLLHTLAAGATRAGKASSLQKLALLCMLLHALAAGSLARAGLSSLALPASAVLARRGISRASKL